MTNSKPSKEPMGFRGWLIHRPIMTMGIGLAAISTLFSYQYMVESTLNAGYPMMALVIALSPLFIAYAFYRSLKDRPKDTEKEGDMNE